MTTPTKVWTVEEIAKKAIGEIWDKADFAPVRNQITEAITAALAPQEQEIARLTGNEIQEITDHEGLIQCRALLGITNEEDNVYDGIKRLQQEIAELREERNRSMAQLNAVEALADGLQVTQQELEPGSYGHSAAYMSVRQLRTDLATTAAQLQAVREALEQIAHDENHKSASQKTKIARAALKPKPRS